MNHLLSDDSQGISIKLYFAQSMTGSKDQESLPSSTTPDPGYLIGK